MGELKFEFEGTTYDVPCMPEKECTWMTDEFYYCRQNSVASGCAGDCRNCVYAAQHNRARKAFYYQCFPEEAPKERSSCENCKNYIPKEEPKKELPKLTKEVFDREDCPKWASYAAVDANGRAYWYKSRPLLDKEYFSHWFSLPRKSASITGTVFDASDWEHSLIARDSAVSCVSLKWPTWFKYSKTTGKYYVMRSAEKYFIVGTVLAVEEVPYDVVDVNPFFKYPAALVGEKVRELWSEDHEVSMVIAASNRGVTLGGESEERSIRSFIKDFGSCEDIPLCSFKEVE